MELVVGIPLFDFIVENKNNYNEEQARIIIKKILNGISYLHENHVCHRDLKPENIIIIPKENEYEFDIKLVDFGYAKDIEEESEGRNSPRIGTLGYKAPEIFKQQEYDKSVDMWALGVITYILLCGFPPFFSHSEYKTDLTLLRDAPFWFFFNNETKELEEQILSGKVDFPKPFWDIISEKAKNFVCLLLEVNPKKRMTAKEALNHSWMNEEVEGVNLLGTAKRLNKYLPQIKVLQKFFLSRPTQQQLIERHIINSIM